VRKRKGSGVFFGQRGMEWSTVLPKKTPDPVLLKLALDVKVEETGCHEYNIPERLLQFGQPWTVNWADPLKGIMECVS
jgi:hypothetical protein